MPRIRTITVAGVFAGATILGGAGLAGATDSDSTIADVGLQEVEAELLQSTEEPSTGESDLTATEEEGTGAADAPTLPDAASDGAEDALTAAFGDRAAGDDEQVDGAEDPDVTETEEVHDPAAPDNHGQHVSETAQTTDPGPGHGEDVSSVAREHGQSQPAGGSEDELQDEDAETEDAETEDAGTEDD